MKKLLILLILLLTLLNVNAQCHKYEYRPAPKVGEVISITGVCLLAYVMAQPRNQSNLLVGAGYLLCFTGIVIDINSNDHRSKYTRSNYHKYKPKRSIFASGEGIGVKLNF